LQVFGVAVGAAPCNPPRAVGGQWHSLLAAMRMSSLCDLLLTPITNITNDVVNKGLHVTTSLAPQMMWS
jgi:hypothetical protein